MYIVWIYLGKYREIGYNIFHPCSQSRVFRSLGNRNTSFNNHIEQLAAAACNRLDTTMTKLKQRAWMSHPSSTTPKHVTTPEPNWEMCETLVLTENPQITAHATRRGGGNNKIWVEGYTCRKLWAYIYIYIYTNIYTYIYIYIYI